MNDQDFIFSFDYIKLEKREKGVCDRGRKKSQNDEKQNILKPCDYFSLNEIRLSKSITQLSEWDKYMNPILDSAPVKHMNNKILLVKRKMDVTLLSFLKDKREKRERRERRERIKKGDKNEESEMKETIVQIIVIYNSLLNILEWTGEQNGLVTLSCELDKISLNEKGQAILEDFSSSFFIKDFTGDIKEDLVTSFAYLDIHVLFYLNQLSENESLSSNNVHIICNKFINGLKILDIFSLHFLQEYESRCIFSLQKLINMKKERILVELLKGSMYWDHFSMSLMFLIIGKILNTRLFDSNMLNNIMNSMKNSELTFC